MAYNDWDTMADWSSSRTGKLQQLFALAAGQAGHFTTAQARDLGYSARSLVHHVQAGHLDRVSRGFYRLRGVPEDRHEDVVAAWLRFRSRQAVVSHDTALTLYELTLSRSQAIHLTVPRRQRPRSARPAGDITVHTTVAPLRRAEVTRRFGVTLTSPARTIVDVAEGGGDPSVVIDAVRRGLGNGLVAGEELRRAVRRRSARVRRLVARALEEADSGA
jgi:predicted transcriptional regulator of viral defense system